MPTNRQRVNALTVRAHALLEDAARVREAFPPRWRLRAYRRARAEHATLVEAARCITERAARIPPDPPRR